MALAKYIIQIPTTDNEGNKLKDLAAAAHESLYRYAPVKGIQGTRIRRGIQGNWADDEPETFDDLEVYADDSPEVDSTMKELAVHVAELANQWGVMVFKEGEGAPKAWQMEAPNVTGTGPADEAAIAEYATPVQAAVHRAKRS